MIPMLLFSGCGNACSLTEGIFSSLMKALSMAFCRARKHAPKYSGAVGYFPFSMRELFKSEKIAFVFHE